MSGMTNRIGSDGAGAPETGKEAKALASKDRFLEELERQFQLWDK